MNNEIDMYVISYCSSDFKIHDQQDSQELVTGWYNFDYLLVCIVIMSFQRKLSGAIIGFRSYLLLGQNLIFPFRVISQMLFDNCVDIYQIRKAIFSNPFPLNATVGYSQEKCRLFLLSCKSSQNNKRKTNFIELTEVRSNTYLISSDHTNSSLSWSCLIMDSFRSVLKMIVELETIKLCVTKIPPHIS